MSCDECEWIEKHITPGYGWEWFKEGLMSGYVTVDTLVNELKSWEEELKTATQLQDQAHARRQACIDRIAEIKVAIKVIQSMSRETTYDRT